MLETQKRDAANTMGVQNGDGLLPAEAGSLRKVWQASGREGRKGNGPRAEGTVNVRNRGKQDRHGS